MSGLIDVGIGFVAGAVVAVMVPKVYAWVAAKIAAVKAKV